MLFEHTVRIGRAKVSDGVHLLRFATGGLAFALVLWGLAMADGAWAHGTEKHEPAVQGSLSQEEQAVVDALNSYAAAFAAKDMDLIESHVITDDRFSSLEGTFQDLGWASYRKHLEPEMAVFGETQYAFSNIRPYVSGDMAYATLDYQMDVVIMSDQFEGGKHPVSMKGKATMVLAKQDGAWKIQHMHTARARSENDNMAGNH